MDHLPREHCPILIIDDSEDDVYATKRAFAESNLHNEIVHIASGEEALSYLRDEGNARPGLIILDLNMPGLNGLKTLEIIKQNNTLKAIPVVVLTTSDDDRDIKACYALGANTYILKPVNFDHLIEAMKRLKEYWFQIAILPKNC